MSEILKHIPHLLTKEELNIATRYRPTITNPNRLTYEERLIQLMNVYDLFIPNEMTYAIYETLYFALIRSYQRKSRLLSGKGVPYLSGGHNSLDVSVLTGTSGIGKTTAIKRCIEVIGNNVIEIKEPHYIKMVPFIFVEAVSTNSFKTFLLNILSEIDRNLGTSLFKANNSPNVYVDTLMNAVSKTLAMSCGVIVIDEIDRFITGNKSMTMINFLTQLINQAGVSVIFSGTEYSREIFSRTRYLCRRSLGDDFRPFEYGEEYLNFMKELFDYQCTDSKLMLTSQMAKLFYKYTGGVLALLITLFYNAQKCTLEARRDEFDANMVNCAFHKKMMPYTPYLEFGKIEHPKINRTNDSDEIIINQLNAKIKEGLFKEAAHAANKDFDLFIELLKGDVSIEVIKC